MTEAAETLLVSILSAQTALAGIPIRRAVDDEQLVRPIITISGKYASTELPAPPYDVARIDLDVTLETQVHETTDAQHKALIAALAQALPGYGKWTEAQTLFETVYFGALQGAEKRLNELIRSHVFSLYLIGRLTVPSQ